MKRILFVLAVATMSVTLFAGRSAAQGPAGSGAGSAASGGSSSSSGGHSLNPIKWVKKDKSADDQLDAKAEQEKKLTANLQAQGVLAANTDAKTACENFNRLDDCVAALHASKNVGLDFNCLKSNLTGVQTGADMSSCKGPAGDRAVSLTKAIHAMKPDADAKTEAKNAEKEAKDDLKASGI
jgi:hypothetical protein